LHVVHVVGKASARAPHVDLERQRVAPWRGSQHMAERRVRHQPAIPIELALDLHRREAWRQCARGHDVLRLERLTGRAARVVEILKVAGSHVDRTHRDTHGPFVDAIEIDKALERALELRGVVEARLHHALLAAKPRRDATGHEEVSLTLDDGPPGLERTEYLARRGARVLDE